ncbi:MAG: GNAT family N-acetyltransferase [Chloroflexi bacterium]|nr:GNAT family N-acetyltransferase [Chloroflexota bacterium]
MTEISYRWMNPNEVHRFGEIDRSERIRMGYEYADGSLQKLEVHWDTPTFFAEGTGEHTVAAQIAFFSEHLSRNGRMLGAFDSEELVGIGLIQHEICPGLSQLASLHVSNAYRRQGIASRLVKELMDVARRDGANKMYVSATPSGSAVGFYLSQGFRPTAIPIPELYELEPEDIHMLCSL